MRGLRVGVLAGVVLIVLATLTGCAPVPVTGAGAPAASSTTPGTGLQPGDSVRKLTVNGLERSYLVHIPPGLDASHAAPVLFAFHGSQMLPGEMESVSGFNEIADKEGFIVVYPAGVGEAWNVGLCCGEASAENVDDIAFVRQILVDLQSLRPVDTAGIYATGFSNGGAFTYRVGCEMPDVFAGIAPVAGGIIYRPCDPKRSISLLITHGLADTTIPYLGGGGSGAPSVEEIVDQWTKLDGCTGAAQVDKPSQNVKHSVYASCQAGTAVEVYAIDNWGHNWPPTKVLAVSQIIWDFFAAHPRK